MPELDITWALGYPCVLEDKQIVRPPRMALVKSDSGREKFVRVGQMAYTVATARRATEAELKEWRNS